MHRPLPLTHLHSVSSGSVASAAPLPLPTYIGAEPYTAHLATTIAAPAFVAAPYTISAGHNSPTPYTQAAPHLGIAVPCYSAPGTPLSISHQPSPIGYAGPGAVRTATAAPYYSSPGTALTGMQPPSGLRQSPSSGTAVPCYSAPGTPLSVRYSGVPAVVGGQQQLQRLNRKSSDTVTCGGAQRHQKPPQSGKLARTHSAGGSAASFGSHAAAVSDAQALGGAVKAGASQWHAITADPAANFDDPPIKRDPLHKQFSKYYQ